MLKLVYNKDIKGLMIMKRFNKYFGFTLSEVMITLSIIGVVATLTISTVGASVQQRARLAEFRSAYAKFETNLRSMILDEGRIYACYACPDETDISDFGLTIDGICTPITARCEDFLNVFVRQMGATRFCESDARGEGCIPEENTRYQAAPDGSGCFSEFGNAYVLDNSMILMQDEDPTIYAVDVNGRKGPNKWGQDIFTFQIKATEIQEIRGASSVKNVGFLPPTDCLPKNGGTSKSSDELMKDSVNYRE